MSSAVCLTVPLCLSFRCSISYEALVSCELFVTVVVMILIPYFLCFSGWVHFVVQWSEISLACLLSDALRPPCRVGDDWLLGLNLELG
jgi:hypothetical protein